MNGLIWMPLLQHLTQTHQNFLVWKNLDRALAGQGDIDAAAPREALNQITGTISSCAASDLGASAIIQCDHIPNVRLHFFLTEEVWPSLLELDVATQPLRYGAKFASPEQMLVTSTIDDRSGIRRTTRAAEAVVVLVLHGLSIHGEPRLDEQSLRLIQEALAAEPDNVHTAANVLLPRAARAPLDSLLNALLKRSWNNAGSRQSSLAFLASALSSPGHAFARVGQRARVRLRGHCLMADLVYTHKRQSPIAEPKEFLTAAAATGHQVSLLSTRASGPGRKYAQADSSANSPWTWRHLTLLCSLMSTAIMSGTVT